MPPRPTPDGAVAPELSPAEIERAAQHLAIVARCPIARLARASAPPGVHVAPESDEQMRRHVQLVTDCGRALFDMPISEVFVDEDWLAAVEVIRAQKSADIARRCAGCLAGRTCRAAATDAPVVIRTRRGLSLLG